MPGFTKGRATVPECRQTISPPKINKENRNKLLSTGRDTLGVTLSNTVRCTKYSSRDETVKKDSLSSCGTSPKVRGRTKGLHYSEVPLLLVEEENLSRRPKKKREKSAPQSYFFSAPPRSVSLSPAGDPAAAAALSLQKISLQSPLLLPPLKV